jgi:hypothetical protein
MPIEWTSEKIGALSAGQLENLRTNALQKGAVEVVAMCDAEIERRKPTRKKAASSSKSHSGEVVLEFHFVCRKEQNVEPAPNGFLWTGTWWVSRKVAKEAAKFASYVALHEARAQPSYLQGEIRDIRVSKRKKEYVEGQPVKNEIGIDFLIQPTEGSLVWSGDATGEKGYRWGPKPGSREATSDN